MPSTEKSDIPFTATYGFDGGRGVFCYLLVVLGRGGEAQRGPESSKSSEMPRGLVPSTEKSDIPYTGTYGFDGGRGVFCYFSVLRAQSPRAQPTWEATFDHFELEKPLNSLRPSAKYRKK